MVATLEDLTLVTLRNEVRTEFGGDTALNAEITSAINRAISLIWQESKTWRWSLKYITLTSLPQISVPLTAPATLGATTITVDGTGTLVNVASAIMRYTFQIAGDPNDYLVSANAANTVGTLAPGLLKAAASGAIMTIKQAWMELPADFAYMHTLRTESGTTLNKRVIPAEPWVLEAMRKSLVRVNAAYQACQFYAILPDPLPYATTGWQPNRQYISYWPYPTSLTKWDGFYYSVPKDLTADADIVEIPRGWRRRLFFLACQLLAGKLRDWEARDYYQQLSLIGAAQMADSNAFSDDIGNPLRELTWSYSDLIRNSVVVG